MKSFNGTLETVEKRNTTLAKLRAEGWDPFKSVHNPEVKYIHITDGIIEKRVPFDYNIPDGWRKGRKPRGKINRVSPAWNKDVPNTKLKGSVWVCSDSDRRQVPKEEIPNWLEKGYQKGMNFKG